jgi:endo-1,4-beta-mannosidase
VNAPFHTGVNYWPASSAMRWWRRFDADEVARDFARVHAAGADLVRLFLRWEDFQPDPAKISDDALGRLRAVADIAERANLRIIPTLFTGHMSGANFIPEWALAANAAAGRFRVITGDNVTDRAIRNWYADEAIGRAQATLARECARALGGHPALWGWDLGNENSNCCVPPTRDDGLRWLERVAEAIRSADAGCQLTVGIHLEDLEEDRRIGPAEAARVSDVLSMHGYPIYASWSAGPLDDRFVAFLAEVTRWLGGKDVLFTELGAPTRNGDADAEQQTGAMLLSEDDTRTYLSGAIERLRSTGATGALVWCHADYARAIWTEPPLDRAPHERHFGLWRADGRPKPAVDALVAASRKMRVPPVLPPWSDELRARFYESPKATLVRLYASTAAVPSLARPLL